MDPGATAARRQIRFRALKRHCEQREAERDEQQDGGTAPHDFNIPRLTCERQRNLQSSTGTEHRQLVKVPVGKTRAYTGYVIKHVNRLAAIFAIAAASYAQTAPARKSFQFHGKVTAVSSEGLTVDGDKVEGWMEKMTMIYKVDDPKVLKTVKAGDEINATVYEGDLTLHKVTVAAKTKK